MLEDRETKSVDLFQNWLKSRIVELKIVDVRADNHALHAQLVDAAIDFAERSFDVFQGQARQTNKPVGITTTLLGQGIVY